MCTIGWCSVTFAEKTYVMRSSSVSLVSMCSLHSVHLVRACTMVEIHTRLFEYIFGFLNQIFDDEKTNWQCKGNQLFFTIITMIMIDINIVMSLYAATLYLMSTIRVYIYAISCIFQPSWVYLTRGYVEFNSAAWAGKKLKYLKAYLYTIRQYAVYVGRRWRIARDGGGRGGSAGESLL